MGIKRHAHMAKPAGLPFDEIDEEANRMWTLHPTKGIRSHSVGRLMLQPKKKSGSSLPGWLTKLLGE